MSELYDYHYDYWQARQDWQAEDRERAEQEASDLLEDGTEYDEDNEPETHR